MGTTGVPIPVWDGELGEVVAVTASGGGTALTNGTPTFIPVHEGTSHIFVTASAVSGGANVVQFTINPYLSIYKTGNNLTTETDYSQVAQQVNPLSSVVLDILNTLASGGYIIVGSHIPFRGVNVTVGTANTNVSTLSVKYWNGTSFVTATPTDGTSSAGATFAVSGNITWTVPTDWKLAALTDVGLNISGAITRTTQPMYWTQWTVSAQLSATVRLSQMLSMSRFGAAYAELLAGQNFSAGFVKGVGHQGCIEATVGPAGTGNIIVNTSSRYGTGYLT